MATASPPLRRLAGLLGLAAALAGCRERGAPPPQGPSPASAALAQAAARPLAPPDAPPPAAADDDAADDAADDDEPPAVHLGALLPRVERARLANGLTILLVEDPTTPLVRITLAIDAGDRRAPDDLPHLARLTADLLPEGTSSYDRDALAARIEAIGGDVAHVITVDDHHVRLSASLPASDADAALQLLAAEATAPTLAGDALERHRARIARLLAMDRGSDLRAILHLSEALTLGDAAERGRVDDEAALRRITRAHVVDFHRRHYTPEGAVLVVLGDLRLRELRALAARHLGAWRGRAAPPPKIERPPPPSRTIVHLVDHPAYAAHVVAAATQAPPLGAPGAPEAALLRELLRRRGTIVGDRPRTWSAFYRARADGRSLLALAWLDRRDGAQATERALRDLLARLCRLADAPVTDAELDRARGHALAWLARELVTPEALEERLLAHHRLGLGDDAWARHRDGILQATPASIQATAAALWGAGVHVIAAGPAAELQPRLAPLGEVRVRGLDGAERP